MVQFVVGNRPLAHVEVRGHVGRDVYVVVVGEPPAQAADDGRATADRGEGRATRGVDRVGRGVAVGLRDRHAVAGRLSEGRDDGRADALGVAAGDGDEAPAPDAGLFERLVVGAVVLQVPASVVKDLGVGRRAGCRWWVRG